VDISDDRGLFNVAGQGGQSIAPRRDTATGLRPRAGEPRFGFLMHPLTAEGIAVFDTSLAALKPMELEQVFHRLSAIVEPFRLSRARVVSRTGQSAYGEFFIVPRTAQEFVEMAPDQARIAVKAAIHKARTGGAQIIGLGAFTSVVTHGGLAVSAEGAPVTTGNSYAAVSSAEAIGLALERLGDPLDGSTTVAIVGATGAIGRAMALLLSEDVGRLVLVGNPARSADALRKRLLNVGSDLVRHLAGCCARNQPFLPGTLGDRLGFVHELNMNVDLPFSVVEQVVENWEMTGRLIFAANVTEALQAADVVVTATSATGTVIEARQLKHGAVVCDVSRPASLTAQLAHRPDVLVIDGGVIAVPGLPFLGQFGLDPGFAYACMAETMMLALDGHFQNTSLGTDLTTDSLRRVRDSARRHGFAVGRLQSFGRLLDDKDFEKVLAGRTGASWKSGTEGTNPRIAIGNDSSISTVDVG
jgi:predicted amino acid dehydrogenase